MKLRRISTMAAALIGVTGAGTASASVTRLCVDGGSSGSQCIWDEFPGQPAWPVSLYPPPYVDTMAYPSPNGSTGMIKDVTTGYCLQLNAAQGYIVVSQPCINDAAERWTNVYVNGRTEFRSVWDPNTCLSANYHYDEIVAQTCVGAWWQGWGTS